MNTLFRCFLLLIVVSYFGISSSCSSSLQKDYVAQVSPIVPSDLPAEYAANRGKSPCRDRMNYVPDLEFLDHTPEKKVKVSVHYMLSEKVKNNFNETDGYQFANQIIYHCNKYLKDNLKMSLPVGNKTPQLPLRYSYLLDVDKSTRSGHAVYFHRDDELYHFNGTKSKDKNYGSREVYKKYGKNKGKVLNIFMMEPHLDSLDSPTFQITGRGVAFGDWVKMTAVYQNTRDTVVSPSGFNHVYGRYAQQRTLNHEIGHCLGLGHSWRKNDGCDDTPAHANCWGLTGKPPCNGKAISNNMMDYIPVAQSVTPCQIGTTHMTMSNKTRKVRGCLKKTWCTFNKEKTIEIKQDHEWNGAKDIEGHLVVMDGATLTLRCRLSLPRKAKIIVYPKGKLILDGATLENDCGQEWEGIEVWSYNEDKGEVVYFNSPTINNAKNKITVL